MNSRDWVDWIVVIASVASALGIVGTIVVYVWSKKDNEKNKKEELKILTDIITAESKKIESNYKNIKLVLEKLKNYKHDDVKIRLRANAFSFMFDSDEEEPIISIILNYHDLLILTNSLNNISRLDLELYNNSLQWVINYSSLKRNLESIFCRFNPSSPLSDKLNKNQIKSLVSTMENRFKDNSNIMFNKQK